MRLRLLAACILPVLLTGCATVSYYWQAALGQFEIGRVARPVAEVISEPATPADLRARLEYAVRAREFASRALGLPDNQSYRRYADLRRPFVVWNVFAAPGLSLQLRTHCFPVAGCVVYRGYFAKSAADAEALALRAEGLDVYVGGVPAYSTLGWFSDPLLNTFMRYPEIEIARLIFHELAHQVAYVTDDSTFNESFAVAVEQAGLERWMAGNATPEQRARFAGFAERRRELGVLLLATRRQLSAAYASSSAAPAKEAAKRDIFAALAVEYARMKSRWGLSEAETRAYDDWLLKDLNNAKLGSIATYTRRVPQFAALLAREGGQLPVFYEQVRLLAGMPREQRNERLDHLAAAAGEE